MPIILSQFGSDLNNNRDCLRRSRGESGYLTIEIFTLVSKTNLDGGRKNSTRPPDHQLQLTKANTYEDADWLNNVFRNMDGTVEWDKRNLPLIVEAKGYWLSRTGVLGTGQICS